MIGTLRQSLNNVQASRAYDIAMRLPAVGFNLFLLARESESLISLVSQQADPSDRNFLLAVVARLALMAFLVTLAAFHLVRHRPVRRSVGVMPRLAALLGATIGLLLLLLPRAEPNPLHDLASTALILLGNGLSLVAVFKLKRSLSIMPEARKLVTGGLYRLVRHPLYAVEEIAMIGAFLQFRSWPAALLLSVHFGFQLLRMRHEEQVLTAAFPDYEDYRRRTPALIPGLPLQMPALIGLTLAAVAVSAGGTALAVFEEPYYQLGRVTVGDTVSFRFVDGPSRDEGPCLAALDRLRHTLAANCPTCGIELTCSRRLDEDLEAALRQRPMPHPRPYVTAGRLRQIIDAEDSVAVPLCRSIAEQLRSAGSPAFCSR